MTSVTILTGSTASGKSAYALELADTRPSVIINADAMQLYREAPILTAQPSAEEQARHPHRLYGVLDARDPSTAARWAALAAEEIRAAWANGLHPIVVGGTGMYIKTLMKGIAPIPAVPPEIRAEIRDWREAEGNHAVHQWLQQIDPATAARLEPGDTQRLVRAAEVYRATGTPISTFQAMPPQPYLPEAEYDLRIVTLPRTELYARIDARFLTMLEAGALDEARTIRNLGLPRDLPLLKAVGLPELLAHLDGRISLAGATRRAQQHSRNYAKRQETWLANVMKP